VPVVAYHGEADAGEKEDGFADCFDLRQDTQS